ncbi:uncharacterized mitochondrial protein-like protein [Tanacetum coccineum]
MHYLPLLNQNSQRSTQLSTLMVMQSSYSKQKDENFLLRTRLSSAYMKERQSSDLHTCLFVLVFLSRGRTKRVSKALVNPSRVESYVIEEEVYVCQPLGFEDPDHPDKVYKVQQKKKGIFISQDKYVHEILRKFNYTDVKSASTPTDLEKPLVQDGDAAEVDEHLYRSMIGSLMYLTASRPDIIFAIPKGKPSLGLWYLKDSPLKLVAYTNSDYAGATQDRKSTTEGCQF